MGKIIKVTARTPLDDYNEYYYYGDINDDRLVSFMNNCAKDTADRFDAPEDWDIDDWFENTKVVYEEVNE